MWLVARSLKRALGLGIGLQLELVRVRVNYLLLCVSLD